MHLQRIAVEAVRLGMISVDEQIRKQRRFRGETPPTAQAALIAIDPHTGEVKALVGGRNYGLSQLNHVLAKRQPGSIFKPFVYAAALDTGVSGGSNKVFTASTIVVDEPTTFYFDPTQPAYAPNNFEHKFYGDCHISRWLARSLQCGDGEGGADGRVRQSGGDGQPRGNELQDQPTRGGADPTTSPPWKPSAPTRSANGGDCVNPASFPWCARGWQGGLQEQGQKRVLDPRIAYTATNLMEEVLLGTAAGVRAQP